MNIFVTGGAGFIGSHIVDELIANNHNVTVFDNLSTGRIDNINPQATLNVGDLLTDELNEAFHRVKPEVVIHLAAQIDVQRSISQPSADASVNVVGTARVLEQCRDHGVRKIIFASSAAVYGTPQQLPIGEEHPIRPLSFYGLSKYTSEHYIELFAELSGLDYTVLRYANVFGPRQASQGEGGVVSIFADQLNAGRTPVIFGDGEQTRDFIYAKDIAKANAASLSQGSGQTVNVSSGEKVTVNELLRIMCELYGTPFQAEYRAPRSGDILHSCLDRSKAKRVLAWEPLCSLREGLEETIAAFRKTQP